jgi:hypothetical protein
MTVPDDGDADDKLRLMTVPDDGDADDNLRLMTVTDDTFHVMTAERMDI